MAHKHNTKIAVIGMAAHFPGATTVEQFWHNLCAGEESITSFSREQLLAAGIDAEQLSNPNYVGSSPVLEGFDTFDNEFFTYSPKESDGMDPQHRLLLQVAWQTLEDAGYSTENLKQRIGVIAGSGGVVSSHILPFFQNHPNVIGSTGSIEHVGNDKDFAPSKISYKLNLTGPSLAVQTACSTSLVAVHLGCQSLIRGESDMVLAGASSVRTPHITGYLYERDSIQSRDGHVRAFDAKANGTVFGSGVGLVLLKPLEQAWADGDNIYSVILGSAINNDGGNKMSYMATKASGQIDCIKAAFKNANISPDDVDYIEAHGTGTAMGDPVEVSSLVSVFREKTERVGYCGIGSVKNNLGHLDIAAGIASLIKSSLILKYRTLPPTINYDTPNPKIQFETSPFFVNREVIPLQKEQSPLRVGINGLGIGGTNAFLLLEEAAPVSRKKEQGIPVYPIILSAKTETALEQRIEQLLNWLNLSGQEANFSDIAYTLCVGRTPFRHRCGMVVKDKEELIKKLTKLRDKSFVRGVFQSGDSGNAFQSVAILQELTETIFERLSKAKKSLRKEKEGDTKRKESLKLFKELTGNLVELFANRVDIQWQGFFTKGTGQRISLPGYPFKKTRFKGSQFDATSTFGTGASTVEWIHPLLHKNTSSISGLNFSSVYSGNEFFFRDHVVKGDKVLPGAAHLELARAAVWNALGAQESNEVELKQVRWLSPLRFTPDRKIQIGLFLKSAQEVDFEIFTEQQNGERLTFSEGCATLQAIPINDVQDIAALRARCQRAKMSGSHCYQIFQKLGLDYGKGHQAIQEVFLGDGEVLAALSLSELKADLDINFSATEQNFLWHPSLVDGAFQSSLFLQGDRIAEVEKLGQGESLPAPIPFSIETVSGNSRKELCWAWVKLESSRGGIHKMSVALLDEHGRVGIRLSGFVARDIHKKKSEISYYSAEWQQKTLPETTLVSGSFPSENSEGTQVLLCGWSKAQAQAVHLHLTHHGMQNFTVVDVPKPSNEIAEQFEKYTLKVIEQCQSIIQSKPKKPVNLQVVLTSNNAFVEGITGLLQSAEKEQPMIRGQVIGIPIELDTSKIADYLMANQTDASIVNKGQVSCVEYQDGERWVRHWQEQRFVEPESTDATIWRTDGVYLITGGAGGLGRIFAQAITTQAPGAKVILTGRRRIEAVAQQLEGLEQSISYRQLDTSDVEIIKSELVAICQEYGSITGVLHSAGVLRDGFMFNKKANDVQQVLSPKVQGLLNLDTALLSTSPEFLILFSSVTSVLGQAGQVDYGAANGFMDGYARVRQARGLRTLAINWPLWESGGMQMEGAAQQALRAQGFVGLENMAGVEACQTALRSGLSQVVVFAGDAKQIRQQILKTQISPKNQNMSALSRKIAESQLLQNAPVVSVANTAPNLTAKALLLDKLKGVLAKVTDLPVTEIDGFEELEAYGIDSVMVTRLNAELSDIFGDSLSITLFFEYPTLAELGDYLLSAHAQECQQWLGTDAISDDLEVEQASGDHKPAVMAATPHKEASIGRLKEPLLDKLKAVLATVTGLPVSEIDGFEALEAYGIDSVMVTRLNSELSSIYGDGLSITLFFEYPTLAALSGYLLSAHEAECRQWVSEAFPLEPISELAVSPTNVEAAEEQHISPFLMNARTSTNESRIHKKALAESEPEQSNAQSDIAIIGVAGRYPQANNLQAFWENLRSGRNCVTEIPESRWQHRDFFRDEEHPKGGNYCRWGGFIDGVDEFDAFFFNITPVEARRIDPQERLFLQVAYHTLEDAGYTRESLQRSVQGNVGVYVGVMYDEYPLYGVAHQVQGKALSVSGSLASIANRASYFCNFNGPSVAVDSMCSSSLSALHMACQAIKFGECDLALVGGTNLSLHPNKYITLEQGKFSSSDGRCNAFGADGDGYVPSEGVGAVLLKPKDKAIADNDHLYAVIRSTSVNHGGKTNGYTVPNPAAQAKVIADALSKAKIDPAHISYVEAHGTGTSLGDPIEISGLSKAFQQTHTGELPKQYCAIGSVKTAIGHCESAAGIASLTKVLLQMQHQELAPSPFVGGLNPNIDFHKGPFKVQTELQPWCQPRVLNDGQEQTLPRMAGISSFGAGGANVHIIVEEFTANIATQGENDKPSLIVLSARSPEQLREQAEQLHHRLQSGQYQTSDHQRIAYTLQLGREAFEERMGTHVKSLEELKEKLQQFLSGEVRNEIKDGSHAGGWYRGRVKRDAAALSAFAHDEELSHVVQNWAEQGKTQKLLEFWIDGLHINWRALYTNVTPQKLVCQLTLLRGTNIGSHNLKSN